MAGRDPGDLEKTPEPTKDHEDVAVPDEISSRSSPEHTIVENPEPHTAMHEKAGYQIVVFDGQNDVDSLVAVFPVVLTDC